MMSDPTMPSGVTRTRRNTSGPSRSKEKIPGVSKEVSDSLRLLNNNLVSLTKVIENSGNSVGRRRESPLANSPDRTRVPRPERKEGKESKRFNKTKIGQGLEGIKNSIISVGKRNEDSVKSSLLGPIRLLTSPIEDFFGGSLFEGFLHPKTKTFTKKKPNRNDVAQTGDMGTLFLVDSLEKKDKDKNANPLDSPMKGFSGILGAGNAFAKTLAGKSLGFGAVAAGLLMAVADGFSGMKKAKDWGVSDPAAFIGGFLGGTKSGFDGAFANMGKWAVTGAGTGFLVAGPVGALIGGLIGGAIGGILGFIGGENIAKGVDAVAKWFKDTFNLDNIIKATPIGAVIQFIQDQQKNFSSDKPFLEKIGNLFGGIGKLWWDWITSPLKILEGLTTGDRSKSFFKKAIDFNALFKVIGTKIGEFFRITVPMAIKSFMATLGNIGNQLKGFDFTKVTDAIFEGVGQFITGFLGGLGLQNLDKDPAFKLISNLGKDAFKAIGQVLNFFGSIAGEAIAFVSKAGSIVADLMGGRIKLFDAIGKIFTELFNSLGKVVDIYFRENPIGMLIKQYIITPITGFFNSIGDFFDYLGKKGPLGLLGDVASGKLEENLSLNHQNNIADRTKKSRAQAEIQAQSLLGTPLETDFRATQKNSKGPIDIHAFTDYAISKNKVDAPSVNDGIIRKDGTIVHTHPDDTIIATKNDPQVALKGAMGGGELSTQLLQKVVELLAQLVAKPVSSEQNQSTSDLELLIMGGGL